MQRILFILMVALIVGCQNHPEASEPVEEPHSDTSTDIQSVSLSGLTFKEASANKDGLRYQYYDSEVAYQETDQRRNAIVAFLDNHAYFKDGREAILIDLIYTQNRIGSGADESYASIVFVFADLRHVDQAVFNTDFEDENSVILLDISDYSKALEGSNACLASAQKLEELPSSYGFRRAGHEKRFASGMISVYSAQETKGVAFEDIYYLRDYNLDHGEWLHSGAEPFLEIVRELYYDRPGKIPDKAEDNLAFFNIAI